MRPYWPSFALSLVLLGCLGAWPLAQVALNGVQSDLLSLLPASASLPEADRATRHLANAAGNRIFLLVEADDPHVAELGASKLAEQLAKEELLEQVLLDVPKPDLGSFRDLVTRSWGALSTDKAPLSEKLDRRLNSSFPDPMAPAITEDPYGIAADWMRRIPWPMGRVSWDGGKLRTRMDGRHGVLVLAKVRPVNATLAEQDRIAAHCDTAIKLAASKAPGLTVSRAGAAFHAAAAQSSARKDVDLVSWGSLAGIVILMLGVFRSPRMLMLCAGSILAGVIAATTSTLMLFGEIHLLTLVFGTSLLGEAADYSIQMTTARIASPTDAAWHRRVTPGLTFALGTSLIGYAASALVPLPLVRQISVFAIAGITAAYLYIRLVGPATLDRTPAGRAPAILGELSRWVERRVARLGPLHLAAAACVAAAGFIVTLNLPTDDDVRHLVLRPADLVRDEERILALTGDRPALPFLLLLPKERSDEAGLRLAESILPRLDRLRAAGAVERWQTLAQLVPSDQLQQENLRQLGIAQGRERAELADTLTELGLPAPASTFPTLSLADLLATPGSYPFRALRMDEAGGPVHLVRFSGKVDADAVRAAFADDAEIHLVDKADSVSRALGDIRRLWPLWLGITLSLCYLLLLFRYGPTRSALLLLPICIGLAWACPLAALAGTPMSIFSLLALTLVLGVGLNYGIFLLEGGLSNAAALSGVLASAATTLISFGLLGLVSMPALSWLGTTLAIGITVSLLASPLALARRT